MKTLEDLKIKLNSISIYQDSTEKTTFYYFQQLIKGLDGPLSETVMRWNQYYLSLLKDSIDASLPDAFFRYILSHKNPFSKACAQQKFNDTESHLRMAVKKDLDTLSFLSSFQSESIKQSLEETFPQYKKEIGKLPNWLNQRKRYHIEESWGEELLKFVDFYAQNGTGVFALDCFFQTTQDFVIEPVGEFSNFAQISESTIQKVQQVLNEIGKNPPKNVVFLGKSEEITTALQHCLKEDALSHIKVIKLTTRDISRFDSLVEQLHESTCQFILFADQIEYLLKNHKSKLEVALGWEGIHFHKKNVCIFSNQSALSPKLQEFFDEVVEL